MEMDEIEIFKKSIARENSFRQLGFFASRVRRVLGKKDPFEMLISNSINFPYS